GDAALAEATAKRTEASALRDRAFGAFEGYARDTGEQLWSQSLAAEKIARAAYQRGVQGLEAAVALTPRHELRNRIADGLLASIEMSGHETAERQALLSQLARYDERGERSRQLEAPATLRIDTALKGLSVSIESDDRLTHRPMGSLEQAGTTPID